jgi:hypothetical protein
MRARDPYPLRCLSSGLNTKKPSSGRSCEHSVHRSDIGRRKGKGLPVQAMKVYGGKGLQLHSFLLSVLDGGEWPVSRSDCVNAGGNNPSTHLIGGWVGLRAGEDKHTYWAAKWPLVNATKNFRGSVSVGLVTAGLTTSPYKYTSRTWFHKLEFSFYHFRRPTIQAGCSRRHSAGCYRRILEISVIRSNFLIYSSILCYWCRFYYYVTLNIGLVRGGRKWSWPLNWAQTARPHIKLITYKLYICWSITRGKLSVQIYVSLDLFCYIICYTHFGFRLCISVSVSKSVWETLHQTSGQEKKKHWRDRLDCLKGHKM